MDTTCNNNNTDTTTDNDVIVHGQDLRVLHVLNYRRGLRRRGRRRYVGKRRLAIYIFPAQQLVNGLSAGHGELAVDATDAEGQAGEHAGHVGIAGQRAAAVDAAAVDYALATINTGRQLSTN